MNKKELQNEMEETIKSSKQERVYLQNRATTLTNSDLERSKTIISANKNIVSSVATIIRLSKMCD